MESVLIHKMLNQRARVVMRLTGPDDPKRNAGFDNYQDIKKIETLWNIEPN